MKYLLPISLFVLLFIYSAINATQYHVPKRSEQDSIPIKTTVLQPNKKELLDAFPDDVTADTGKISFMKRFNRGKMIYAETCAKCHDSTRNGKRYYPDFSLPQLMDYEMRFQYPEHGEDLKETNITVAELDDVVDFLRYKKKNLVKK
jgi:mono/diheme cytochrome c family protein